MGLYSHFVLPRLLNAAMGTKPVRYQRRKVVPRAQGRVLEVGFGAGHNLPFYDAAKVTHLWALEPAVEMRERAAERVAASPIDVEFIDLPGESIPLDAEAADTILITYTLCTIPDVMKALGEMRRVLKPDGRMIFCEHGEAPDEGVRRWQTRVTPVWKAMAGGCHVGRPIPQLLRDGGFRIETMETMYLPGTPRFAGFNYWGDAVKA
ncbi:MAG TPA: class I SAM-dependent methyltransferase [Rhizomicrobium sp.]|jgi:ubiquinone/menaquinone biosynthesis C-methylase UbiE